MSNSRFGLRFRQGQIRDLVETSSGVPYILDLVPGATVAYSLRRLSSTSTRSIRIRRDSDSAELDIGFIGYALDIDSINTFCKGTNGFVTTWYDQSGNGNNLLQASSTAQPQIYGPIQIFRINNLPCIYTDGSNDQLKTSNNFSYNNATMVIVAGQSSITDGYGRFIDNAFSTGFWFGRDNGTNAINGGFIQPSPPYGNIFAVSNETLFTLFAHRSGATTTSIFNNTATASRVTSASTTTSAPISVGMATDGTFPGRKYHLEYIFYTSNKSSDLSTINLNINNYYAIY